MKQYYKLYNTNTQQFEYWHGDTTMSKFLLTLGRYIIPLGNKLPKNVSRETIKEF